MKKTYIVPTAEIVRVNATLPLATSGPGNGGDDDGGIHDAESKVFGGFAWDDTEE